jgi:hypothetical protein
MPFFERRIVQRKNPKPGKANLAPGGPTLRLPIGARKCRDLNADFDRDFVALKTNA